MDDLTMEKLKNFRWMNGAYSERGIYGRFYVDDWKMTDIKYNNEKFRVLIEPYTKDNISFLKLLLSETKSSSRTIEEYFQSFIASISEMLITHGVAAYEICGFKNDKAKFTLDLLNPQSLKISDKKISQFIPKTEFQEEYRYEGNINEVFLVRDSKSICNGKGLHETYNYLIAESNRQNTPTEFISPYSSDNFNQFNYEKFRYETDLNLFILTRNDGWDIRQLANQRITEFYWIYRKIKFRLRQAKLREYILNEINEQLIPKLKDCPIRHVKVEGVISSDEYLKKIKKFVDGKIEFQEALDLDQSKI